MSPEHGSCDHGSVVNDPGWHGFGQPVKDMDGDTGPCDLCADARCPVGSGLRLASFRIRAAQLVARHGYDVDLEANLGAHGIDLRCTVDGVTQIWEFSTGDPASVKQAIKNRDHIIAYLCSQGIDAHAGVPFADEWSTSLFGPDDIIEVSSHPTELGIEIFDVFSCYPCYVEGSWRYAESRLQLRRLEDMLLTQMRQRPRNGTVIPLDAPNGHPDPSVYTEMHLHLNFAESQPERLAAILRMWYQQAIRLLDDAAIDAIMNAPPDGHHPYTSKGKPGAPAGVLKRASAKGRDDRERQLNASSWAALLEDPAELTAENTVWLGPISDYGWAQTLTNGQYLVLENRSYGLQNAAHALTASANVALMSRRPFQNLVLSLAWRLAEEIDISYAEIGQKPFYASTGVPDLTMLDRLLYRYPTESIAAAPSTARGYAWLTVLTRQLGDTLGGLQALQSTGAFHEVKQLPNGSYWLLATKHFDQYGPTQAERVFRALAPALPPGLPARCDDEPHLIILADTHSLNRQTEKGYLTPGNSTQTATGDRFVIEPDHP